jgi:hypothetical protein
MTTTARRATRALAALVAVAAAGAATYRVSGRQVAVDSDEGIFKTKGSQVGDWDITACNQAATTPLLEANGTEVFNGCLDARGNGCGRRDPRGTLNFTLTYQALFAAPDPASLMWGSCRHPIVSGTAGFADARGVLALVETPTGGDVRTDNIGNITLPGKRRGAHHHAGSHTRAAIAAACG